MTAFRQSGCLPPLEKVAGTCVASLQREAATPRYNKIMKPFSSSGPRHVLVVDDNEDTAETLATLLQQTLGCEVTTAYDGADALDKAGAVHPDVVLMDIGMPMVDGIEAAQLLRRVFRNRPPRLIAVTGRSGDLSSLTGEGGFDAVLTKPAPFERLIEAIAGETVRAA